MRQRSSDSGQVICVIYFLFSFADSLVDNASERITY
jgi:hypothetical protein